MGKHYIIPIFVPHLGCPHDCIFCNQKKIASSVTNISSKQVEETIEEYLSYFKPDSFIEVAFYGGSFTAIDMEIQKELLSVPLKYKKKRIIDEIRISTRPDAIDKFILEHLKKYEVNTIELGAQSLDDEILYKSERGHISDDVYKASKLIKFYGFNLGLQMMVGLPGDKLETSLYTAKEIIKLNPKCVRIYPTLVIKNTLLEKMTVQKKYKPLGLNEAVDICTPILMEFYVNNINVIRVGLQPTENIQFGKDVVDGPFHPAFKQLVEANIYKNILSRHIDKSKITTHGQILEIRSNSKNASNIAAQKSENINFLKKRYGFKNIKIYPDSISLDDLTIKVNEYSEKISIKRSMKEHLEVYEVK